MPVMVQMVAPGNREIWVNAANVTWVAQIGEGERSKIYFAGGEATDVAETAQKVAGKLNTQLRGG